MRKLILATALTGFMGASVALAIPASGTITVGGSPLEYSDGGQFTATVSGFPSFQTYCIEINHEFSLGGTYAYTLGQTTHGAPPATASPVLNLGTAWLFSQFTSGNLGISTPLLAGELQAALWYFQGQGAGNSDYNAWVGGTPGNDQFTDDALTALGGNVILGTGAYSPSAGAYGVQIIQSSTITANGALGDPAQDWLYVPVPDGGATVMLLGIGLVGMVLVSRRFAVAR
jgi:hypothetical protein